MECIKCMVKIVEMSDVMNPKKIIIKLFESFLIPFPPTLEVNSENT
jgi:hypothetical protein